MEGRGRKRSRGCRTTRKETGREEKVHSPLGYVLFDNVGT